MEREKYGEIRQLLKCVSESGMAAKSDGDTILLNCLEAFKRIPPQVRSLLDLLGGGHYLLQNHPILLLLLLLTTRSVSLPNSLQSWPHSEQLSPFIEVMILMAVSRRHPLAYSCLIVCALGNACVLMDRLE